MEALPTDAFHEAEGAGDHGQDAQTRATVAAITTSIGTSTPPPASSNSKYGGVVRKRVKSGKGDRGGDASSSGWAEGADPDDDDGDHGKGKKGGTGGGNGSSHGLWSLGVGFYHLMCGDPDVSSESESDGDGDGDDEADGDDGGDGKKSSRKTQATARGGVKATSPRPTVAKKRGDEAVDDGGSGSVTPSGEAKSAHDAEGNDASSDDDDDDDDDEEESSSASDTELPPLPQYRPDVPVRERAGVHLLLCMIVCALCAGLVFSNTATHKFTFDDKVCVCSA